MKFNLSLPRSDLLILIVVISIYVIGFSTLSILRHNAFASNFDLANMDQTVWNTIHGRIFTMSANEGNVSRLATHADFILIALAPLYLLWDNVRTLLIAQSLILGLGAIPVYFLAKKILQNRFLALVMSLIYLINPGMQWTNLYDFHGVALATPLLITAFYFALTKNWRWYFIFFALSLITKEEISLFLGVMGILIIFMIREWKIGSLSFLVGILWFPMMVFFVIPHFNQNGQHWAFNDWFSAPKADLDSHHFNNLLTLAESHLVSSASISYYQSLLRPMAFLPVLGFPWILMAVPELLINVMSSHLGMQSITLHYESGITPALIISTIFALKYLKRFLSSRAVTFLGVILLVMAIKADYSEGPLPGAPSCWCYMFQVHDDDKKFDEVLKNISPKAFISASAEVRSHITHREKVANLPNIPSQTDYIALINQARSFSVYETQPFESDLVKKLSAGGGAYKLDTHFGHFYLFKRKS